MAESGGESTCATSCASAGARPRRTPPAIVTPRAASSVASASPVGERGVGRGQSHRSGSANPPSTVERAERADVAFLRRRPASSPAGSAACRGRGRRRAARRSRGGRRRRRSRRRARRADVKGASRKRGCSCVCAMYSGVASSGSPPPTTTRSPSRSVTTRVVKRWSGPRRSIAVVAVSSLSVDAGANGRSAPTGASDPAGPSTATHAWTGRDDRCRALSRQRRSGPRLGGTLDRARPGPRACGGPTTAASASGVRRTRRAIVLAGAGATSGEAARAHRRARDGDEREPGERASGHVATARARAGSARRARGARAR